MKCAVVTGASSGMGREFVRQIQSLYPELSEIWVIARRKEKLEELPNAPAPLKIFPLDLTKETDVLLYKKELRRRKPQITLFVHCAGTGILGRMDEIAPEDQIREVRLNCEALTAVTLYTLPYLQKGARVIALASSAAFAPQPGFGVYAATKAYALSFARALRAELKTKRICVTAVCPGPVDTPFLREMEKIKKRPAWKKMFLADPERVVRKALADSGKGAEVSVYGIGMKGWQILSKLIPHAAVLRVLGGQGTAEKSHKKG